MSVFNIFLVTTILGVEYAHSSYYCDFGLCEADQYCCGDNKCCTNVTDLWYFWIGIVIAVIIIIVIVLFKFFRRKTKYKYDSLPLVR
ncbi:WW domain binding protein 1-like [Tribolium madens]|uniref:WW domain binding protein 1-like n=1 Tax=Tribolium madens TaxID=41895 RepID=UPI001CF731A5|nr:WW domain binding protein 1-like [Tribolium madens]